MSSFGVISVEPPMKCEICGDIGETRPYGPNNERICFDCGMKNKVMTERKMAEYLFGDKPKEVGK